MNRFIKERLSANIQEHFHKIDPLEITVKEKISESEMMIQEFKDIVKINSDSLYYIYGKPNNEDYKNEVSLGDLAKLKKSSFRKKRSDLSILEISGNSITAHIIEMKSTLDMSTFKAARQQLLNSLIDVELITLIALNSSFKVNPKFYILYNKERNIITPMIQKSSISSTARLERQNAQVDDADFLLAKEYNSNMIISDMDINNHSDRDVYREFRTSNCKKINLYKHCIN